MAKKLSPISMGASLLARRRVRGLKGKPVEEVAVDPEGAAARALASVR